MNQLVLICFFVTCLMVLAQTAAPDRKLEIYAQKGGRQEYYKGSLGKVWETRDGKWSAGTYVQHTKDKYPGGPNIRDTQAGFEIKGEFKG